MAAFKLNFLFLQAMESKTITNRFTLISCSSILKRFEYEASIANLLGKSLEIMHNRCKFHRSNIFAIEGWNSSFIASVLLLFPNALDLIEHA